MYQAPRMRPEAATTAVHGSRSKPPSRMRNSPMKPFVPGRPTAARVKSRKKPANTGMVVARPP